MHEVSIQKECLKTIILEMTNVIYNEKHDYKFNKNKYIIFQNDDIWNIISNYGF